MCHLRLTLNRRLLFFFIIHPICRVHRLRISHYCIDFLLHQVLLWHVYWTIYWYFLTLKQVTILVELTLCWHIHKTVIFSSYNQILWVLFAVSVFHKLARLIQNFLGFWELISLRDCVFFNYILVFLALVVQNIKVFCCQLPFLYLFINFVNLSSFSHFVILRYDIAWIDAISLLINHWLWFLLVLKETFKLVQWIYFLCVCNL